MSVWIVFERNRSRQGRHRRSPSPLGHHSEFQSLHQSILQKMPHVPRPYPQRERPAQWQHKLHFPHLHNSSIDRLLQLKRSRPHRSIALALRPQVRTARDVTAQRCKLGFNYHRSCTEHRTSDRTSSDTDSSESSREMSAVLATVTSRAVTHISSVSDWISGGVRTYSQPLVGALSTPTPTTETAAPQSTQRFVGASTLPPESDIFQTIAPHAIPTIVPLESGATRASATARTAAPAAPNSLRRGPRGLQVRRELLPIPCTSHLLCSLLCVNTSGCESCGHRTPKGPLDSPPQRLVSPPISCARMC